MKLSNEKKLLPVPTHFNPEQVGHVWKVDYESRFNEAIRWAEEYNIQPADQDTHKIALIAIDVQNTFCIPGFELFVGGRTGRGAVDDNIRLCEFLYRNMGRITKIFASMDTHSAFQIFHPTFIIDKNGKHPQSNTQISFEDVLSQRWMFNPGIAAILHIDPSEGQKHLLYYTEELKKRGKYDLTIWPFHSMLGGIGHALVPAVEEALFFHSIARNAAIDFEIKGSHPLTEHYSIIGPEVATDHEGDLLVGRNPEFIQILQQYDQVIITGQAKSHCVAWTIDDLLTEIIQTDERLVSKVFLLEDCSSPVVVPGVVDYTEAAEAAFQRFSSAGMHVVRSTDPLSSSFDA